MTFQNSLKEAARTITPQRAMDHYRRMRLTRQAKLLNRLARLTAEPAAYSDLLWQSPDFRPIQVKSEITKLIEIVKSLCPETVCEIGTARGGTLFLLTRVASPEATIVTMDIHFDPSRKTALYSFARSGQEIVCLEGDSHRRETLGAVETSLAGRPLDLLFIDGDHSYEGISSDFRLYSPLVRPGGLIVCHDIVPDSKTRYGIKTSADVGGVPQFWNEIKASQWQVEEIIENPEQDGCGIGVLHWPGGPSSPKE
jgi:predicted O-methyltransferase YrrM